MTIAALSASAFRAAAIRVVRCDMMGSNASRRGIGAVAAFFLLGPPVYGEGVTTILVNYDVVRKPASLDATERRTHYSRTYVLSGKNSVSRSGPDLTPGDAHLGQEGTGAYHGASFKWTFRAVGGAFFLVVDYPSYSDVLKIRRLDGGAYACTREIKKKPGFKYFEWTTDSGTKYYSEMRIENVTCAIT